MKTEFKRLNDLIIELCSLPSHNSKTQEEEIETGKDYFYSKYDGKIHKAIGWSHYYFYDERSKAHDDNGVYKVFATSNNIKYPTLKLLTVFDLVRE